MFNFLDDLCLSFVYQFVEQHKMYHPRLTRISSSAIFASPAQVSNGSSNQYYVILATDSSFVWLDGTFIAWMTFPAFETMLLCFALKFFEVRLADPQGIGLAVVIDSCTLYILNPIVITFVRRQLTDVRFVVKSIIKGSRPRSFLILMALFIGSLTFLNIFMSSILIFL